MTPLPVASFSIATMKGAKALVGKWVGLVRPQDVVEGFGPDTSGPYDSDRIGPYSDRTGTYDRRPPLTSQ
jgi:hypothetical protein